MNEAWVWDAHFHPLLMPHSPPDWDAALGRAFASGVAGGVAAATSPYCHDRLLALSQSAQNWELRPRGTTLDPLQNCFSIWSTWGLHPCFLSPECFALGTETTVQKNLWESLERAHALGVSALGEIGLDHRKNHVANDAARFHKSPEEILSTQETLFRFLLDCAAHFKLPVVLHSVHAHGKTISHLKQWRAKGSLIPVLWHSFQGPPNEIPRLHDLGVTVSFATSLLHPSHEGYWEKLSKASLAAFALESDAPDRPPWDLETQSPLLPHTPQHVPLLAAKLAKHRQSPYEFLAQQTTRALQRFLLGVFP